MSESSELQSAITEYLAECDELLQRVSESLEHFKNGTETPEVVDSIYRDVHTLKGSSQLFGFNSIGEVAHALETSLDPVRKNKLKPSPKLVDALFRCVDAIDQMVCAIQAKEEKNFSELIAVIIPQLIESSVESQGGALNVRKEEASPSSVLNIADVSHLQTLPSAPPALPAPLPAASTVADAAVEASVKSAPVSSVPFLASAPSAGHPADQADSSTIRVPVALLDKLMTLMGEMVLVRNQVQQYAGKSDDLGFLNLAQPLDIVTSEIQGEVMKTRMQPIGNVLSKFQRVVRDLARDLNKKIELSLDGAETELDKTLLEAVKDPIMHIVRNSCDHGIETLEERRASKKSETGKISIRSFHEGGQVIVEVSDDGRGLNRDKLINKAIEKGVITPEKAAGFSEKDAHNLIFAPGFSTAKNVTNVSGRGVGMDVVKNNIEGIGGMVELESRNGAGTTIRLKIPLTLAIVPAMIVRSGTEQFAIPQVKLVELVRVEKASRTGQIEYLQGKPVYRLRGNLLPLVQLKEVLEPGKAGSVQEVSDVTNIVVLNAERRMFGLIVDEVQDTAEVVVKPLSSFVKSLQIYSGATVLGDGSIALILDVVGIALNQSMLGDAAKGLSTDVADEAAKLSSEMQEFLLFKLNSPTKYAIPLNLVHRLEEFNRKDIEYSGSQRLVRYRNTILPIISLNQNLGFPSDPACLANESEKISIIVSRKSSKLYGIEVNEILDVLNTPDPMDDGLSDRPGILGNLVTADEVIVVVDALQILDSFASRLQSRSGDAPSVTKSVDKNLQGKKILLVEDTVFFRKHIKNVLHRAGCLITCAGDGAEALKLLEESPRSDFDLVLSDIEMPKMNGLLLAQAIRANSKWAQIPLVAITTRYNEEHVQEGKDAGFDAYLEKLKPEALLNELQSRLANASPRKAAS